MEFNNLLQQEDYQLIAPDTDIQPLNLILRDQLPYYKRWFVESTAGSLNNAELREIFKPLSKSIYPKIKTAKRLENISGVDILDAKAHFAFKFIGKDRAQSKLSQVDKLLFHFKNTQRRYVSQAAVEEFINFTEINEYTTYRERIKKGDVFLVTDVLRSSDMSIFNANDFHFEGKVDAKALNEYFVNLKTRGAFDSKLIHQLEGKGRLKTFAIKIAQITVNNKQQYAIDPAKLLVRGDDENQGSVQHGRGSEVILGEKNN